MYSLKLAHLVKDKLPEAEVCEYYIDMRAFGKGYEEFYNRIAEEGIRIIRGRTAQIEKLNGHLKLRTEDILNGQILELEMDMVILSVGLEPAAGQLELSKLIGIETDPDGWFTENQSVMDPVSTRKPGIRIAGVCQGPKDIPDSVVQASAAAAGVLQSILSGKLTEH
jgi:heterodisulfide reductase subunit A